MMRKLKVTFGIETGDFFLSSSRWTQSQTVRAGRRIIPYSTEVHRRCQKYTHHWMYCWRKYWWLLDRGWRKRIIRCMDRLHKIHFVERKATWRIYMVRVRLSRKQTTSRPDNFWLDMWKHMSDAAKSKAKQKWIIEKPKLDHARQLRGIFFIEPDDE